MPTAAVCADDEVTVGACGERMHVRVGCRGRRCERERALGAGVCFWGCARLDDILLTESGKVMCLAFQRTRAAPGTPRRCAYVATLVELVRSQPQLDLAALAGIEACDTLDAVAALAQRLVRGGGSADSLLGKRTLQSAAGGWQQLPQQAQRPQRPQSRW